MPDPHPANPPLDPPPGVAIVVSRYNASITDRLLAGAIDRYRALASADPAHAPHLVDAPGAFELPVLALAALRTGRFEGALCLGCVIRGQTRHDRYINQAVASGLIDVSIHTGLPACFGVITAETPEQAHDRAGGVHGNKGAEAMEALLLAIGAARALAQGNASPGPLPRPDKLTPGGVRGIAP